MSAWDDEYAPAALVSLGQQVRAALGVSADAIGMKGDPAHTYGYHRSRRWILTDPGSDYGSDDYSVTDPLDQGGDVNWVCALDATPRTVEQMIAVSKRLDAAMRADHLPDVREFYGNVDGDQVVDGWDDLTHRAATSDSSHLWHVHISFYRSRAGNDHTDVLRVITGATLEDDVLTPDQDSALIRILHGVDAILGDLPVIQPGSAWGKKTNELHTRLGEIKAAATTPATVTLTAEDRAAIVADLAPAVADLLAQRLQA